MDTHIVNAVLTGSKSKSILIESISCSSKIIPDKLDTVLPQTLIGLNYKELIPT